MTSNINNELKASAPYSWNHWHLCVLQRSQNNFVKFWQFLNKSTGTMCWKIYYVFSGAGKGCPRRDWGWGWWISLVRLGYLRSVLLVILGIEKIKWCHNWNEIFLGTGCRLWAFSCQFSKFCEFPLWFWT